MNNTFVAYAPQNVADHLKLDVQITPVTEVIGRRGAITREQAEQDRNDAYTVEDALIEIGKQHPTQIGLVKILRAGLQRWALDLEQLVGIQWQLVAAAERGDYAIAAQLVARAQTTEADTKAHAEQINMAAKLLADALKAA